ncbi:hypothetical protein D3C86_1983360 [compost metagenome]
MDPDKIRLGHYSLDIIHRHPRRDRLLPGHNIDVIFGTGDVDDIFKMHNLGVTVFHFKQVVFRLICLIDIDRYIHDLQTAQKRIGDIRILGRF